MEDALTAKGFANLTALRTARDNRGTLDLTSTTYSQFTPAQQSTLSNLDSDIALLNTQITSLDTTITSLNGQISTLKSNIQQLLGASNDEDDEEEEEEEET